MAMVTSRTRVAYNYGHVTSQITYNHGYFMYKYSLNVTMCYYGYYGYYYSYVT